VTARPASLQAELRVMTGLTVARCVRSNLPPSAGSRKSYWKN